MKFYSKADITWTVKLKSFFIPRSYKIHYPHSLKLDEYSIYLGEIIIFLNIITFNG